MYITYTQKRELWPKMGLKNKKMCHSFHVVRGCFQVVRGLFSTSAGMGPNSAGLFPSAHILKYFFVSNHPFNTYYHLRICIPLHLQWIGRQSHRTDFITSRCGQEQVIDQRPGDEGEDSMLWLSKGAHFIIFPLQMFSFFEN